MTFLSKHRELARAVADWCLAQDDLTGFAITQSMDDPTHPSIWVYLYFPDNRRGDYAFATAFEDAHDVPSMVRASLDAFANAEREARTKQARKRDEFFERT